MIIVSMSCCLLGIIVITMIMLVMVNSWLGIFILDTCWLGSVVLKRGWLGIVIVEDSSLVTDVIAGDMLGSFIITNSIVVVYDSRFDFII